MTPRQKQFYDFIQKYRAKNGYSPTYREIGQEFGVTIQSVNTVLMVMEVRGYVKRPTLKRKELELLQPVAA